MNVRRSLSEDPREAAVAWFEKGIADSAAARLLGVPRSPVKLLYQRWKIHGRGALVAKPTKEVYAFEFNLALVERFIAGETAPDLAVKVGLSSPGLLKR
jgi:transposase